MKNYGDRGECYLRPRRITLSEISIILHMIRRPNSIIVLLFIQNNSYSLKTTLKHAYLHQEPITCISVKFTFDSTRLGFFRSTN